MAMLEFFALVKKKTTCLKIPENLFESGICQISSLINTPTAIDSNSITHYKQHRTYKFWHTLWNPPSSLKNQRHEK